MGGAGPVGGVPVRPRRINAPFHQEKRFYRSRNSPPDGRALTSATRDEKAHCIWCLTAPLGPERHCRSEGLRTPSEEQRGPYGETNGWRRPKPLRPQEKFATDKLPLPMRWGVKFSEDGGARLPTGPGGRARVAAGPKGSGLLRRGLERRAEALSTTGPVGLRIDQETHNAAP